MRKALSHRAILRRDRRALRRMSDLQCRIILAMRHEDTSIAQLIERYGISHEEIEAAFVEAILILMRAMDEHEPWWQRLLPW